jgi:Ca2+-binding EF-hand superfamily protein
MDALEQAFISLDKNGDGKIERLEFRQALAKVGVKIPRTALDAIFSHFDIDGDRKISHKEFMRFAVYSPSPLSGLIEQLRHNIWAVSPEKAFENLDEDKDGIITPDEFKRGLERLGMSGLSLEQVKGVANAFGADKKGNIRIEHFINFAADAQGATKSHLQTLQDKLKDLVKSAATKGVSIETSFKHFDKNSDGRISKREFKTAMNELAGVIGGRLTPKEMRKLFYRFDPDKTGSIEYGAFMQFFKDDAPDSFSQSSRDLYAKHTRDIDSVNEKYLQKKAHAVTREAARHEHSIAFYFERYDRYPRKSRISSAGFERAIDASGFFFSPSEIRWINAKFQAQGGGVNYMKFIYWATPESVQGDVVAQHIRTEVQEAEHRGRSVPDVRTIFGRFDKNQNGRITRAGLRTGLTNINVVLRPNELDILIRKYEDGADGIDYQMFIQDVFGLKPLGVTASKAGTSKRDKVSQRSPKRPSAVAESIAEQAMDKLRKLVRIASKRGSDPKVAFEHFDTALKGTISKQEFKRGLKSLDITLLDDEMQVMMKMFGKGQRVDYGEFLSAVAPKRLSSLRMDVDEAISKLRKLVLSRARVKDLKDPFLHFDAERQGHFSPTQLQSGLRMLKIKIGAEKSQLVFEALDINGDGKVDFDDWQEFFDPGSSGRGAGGGSSSDYVETIFIKLRRKIRKSWLTGADYRATFEELDRDFDGTISSGDFKSALRQLNLDVSPTEMRELIKAFDYNERGKVHYLAFLRHIAPSRRRSQVAIGVDVQRSADRLRNMIRSRARSHGGNLRDPFKHFARSGSGTFDLRDFEEGLRKLDFSKKLGRSGQEALFNMIDANKNGKVRFSEFAMFVSGSRYTDAEDKLRALITRAARDWDGGRNLKKAFRKLDTRDDGYITAADFGEAMRDAGYGSLTKREAKDLVLRFDTNGDDRVSYREFVTFVEDRMRMYSDMGDVVDRVQKKLMRASRGDNPWRIFHDMDRDGNGVLDRREFGKGLSKLGVELSTNELDKVMRYFDYNGSGYVGYANFADAVEGRTSDSGGSRRSSTARRPSVPLTRTMERLRTMVKERARDGRFDMRRPFKHFDRENRGTISRRDFENGLRKLDFDLSRSDERELVDFFDINGDGEISFIEFVDTIEGSGHLSRISERTEESSLSSSNSRRSSDEHVFIKIRRAVRKSWRDGNDYRSAFEDYDRSYDGYISGSDFKRAVRDIGLESLSSSDVDIVMDRFDPGRRNKVNYVAFLREMSPSRRGSTSGGAPKAEKAADRLRMMIRQRAKSMKGNLRDPFRHFAQRRSKFDVRDFEEGMRKLEFRLGRRECEDVFNMIDVRRKGKIRFSDFAMFVNGARYTDAEDKLRMLITRAARDWDGGRNLKKAFRKLDTRDDGYITAADFREAMRDAGYGTLSKREAQDLVLRFDENGDDRVSYREFVTFVEDRMRLYTDMGDVVDRVQKKLMRASRGDNPWRIFHDMDRDGNGVLDRREFGQGLRELGIDLSQRDLDRVMDYFDYDKAGFIGYDNFVDMFDGRSSSGGGGSRDRDMDRVMPRPVRDLKERIYRTVRNVGKTWDDMMLDISVRSGMARTSEFSRAIEREFKLDRRDAEDVAKYFEERRDEVDVRKAKYVLAGRGSAASGSSSSYSSYSSSRREPKVPSELREVVDELRNLVGSRHPSDEDFRRFFDKFDRDHSGEIDRDEFGRALRKLGFRLTARQSDRLVDAYGSSSGKLKYYDFLRLLEPGTPGDRVDKLVLRMTNVIRDERADLIAVFRRFDRDDRGYLSRRDFAGGMKDLGIFDLSDSDVRRVMDRFDKDGDGRIDYREFEKTIRSADSGGGRDRDRNLDRDSDRRSNTLVTDISFSGKPSKRDLRSEEAVMIEIVSLRLKDRMNEKLLRDDAKVQVSYTFLERRVHRTEALRPGRRNDLIDFRFDKTFPIERRDSEAFEALKSMMRGSRKDAEIVFTVESTERGGRDRSEGTCVVDLQQILRDANDREYTPSKMLRIPDVGELEIAVRAADCLARVDGKGGSGGSRSLRSSRNYDDRDRDDFRSSRDRSR